MNCATTTTFHINEKNAHNRVGHDQPRLWSLNQWVTLRRDHFGEVCYLIDSGSDPRSYQDFDFEFHVEEAPSDGLWWDPPPPSASAVTIYRYPHNLVHYEWCQPWSLAWLRGVCQGILVARVMKIDVLMYNELDLITKWPSHKLATPLTQGVRMACPASRYGAETSLMLFRIPELDDETIRQLATAGGNSPEDHIAELLIPRLMALKGDRDEDQPARGAGVDLTTADWLTHSGADKMQRFQQVALRTPSCEAPSMIAVGSRQHR